ncbi:MAG: hypothetical protein ABIK83_02160 [Candidatus Zixiibacteriota bacterium]
MVVKKVSRAVPVAVAVLIALLAQTAYAINMAPQLPPSQVRDLITHNKGNIVTTVANWGSIGGFSHQWLPSGEWPKNSGHDYLAEAKYWMGAITASGDTLVVNTDDDLMPIPRIVSGDETYGISVSTASDTYEYDVSDTIGFGIGYPAYGWEVWDPDNRIWVHNQIWDPTTETYLEGGPIAQQESHFRMADDALGSSLLGIEIAHTVYQWNYSYNQDYLFVVLQITNTSDEDYSEFAFGLYCDFDIGGYYEPTGENGRLGDLVAFDQERNLAWTYEEDGYDEGWGCETGVMGTKYIETPDGIGMTAFRTGQWDYLPDNDPGKFELIDSEQFDESLPPTDQYYIQCTRGIDLEAGKTVRVVYALVAAPNEEILKANADMAQAIYNSNFIGPEPPKEATVSAKADDGMVKLWWDNASETTADRFSGEIDFLGYKVYRSTDFGLTWGKKIVNPDLSEGPGYMPLAVFEKQDESDFVNHTFIDSTAINGFEYWYSIVSYDVGNAELNLDPLSTAYGNPGSESNAASVIPHSLPAGYYPIENTVKHTAENSGAISDGRIVVTEFNSAEMVDHEYEVRFSDDPYYTYWHLLNVTTGDTLLSHQIDQTADEEKALVTEGFRLLVQDGEISSKAYYQTEFASGSDTTLRLAYDPVPLSDLTGYPLGGGMHFRSDFELRFTTEGSEGYWWWDDVTPVAIPFEIWNTTTNEQVIAEIIDWDYDGEWTAYNPDDGTMDYIVVVNIPYDGSPHPEGFPYHQGWVLVLDPDGVDTWGPGDAITIYGAPINGPNDVFTFKGSGIDFAAARDGLDNIKVVPNPYIVSAGWEYNEGQRKLEFINLPDICTVRIYTLAGDLVSTVEHSQNGGTASWDLSSSNAQGIAPGIYYYAVDSEYGSKIGKFAVIK